MCRRRRVCVMGCGDFFYHLFRPGKRVVLGRALSLCLTIYLVYYFTTEVYIHTIYIYISMNAGWLLGTQSPMVLARESYVREWTATANKNTHATRCFILVFERDCFIGCKNLLNIYRFSYYCRRPIESCGTTIKKRKHRRFYFVYIFFDGKPRYYQFIDLA